MDSTKAKINYIIIAICTYKRKNELERCILSLQDMNYPENIKTEILIIDNDEEKSAKEIFDKFKNTTNLHYVVEENKGLSNARNKALTESIKLNASHLAFIDDDEIADTDWLNKHIEFYNNFEKIYISSGPTYKKFDKDYPDYITQNRVFKVISKKELGKTKETCASGNVFFPLNIIKDNEIYFDKNFNFSGSEDTDFFKRLSNKGYLIGWNYNAINYEIVGSERANVKWILKRAFHNGYSVSMTRFINKNYNFKRMFYIFEKLITIIVNLLTIIFTIPLGMTKLLNSITRFNKNLGKLYGAIIPKQRIYYGK